MATGAGHGTRNAIHIALSLVAAAVVYTLPPVAAAAVLAAATWAALIAELGRRISPGVGRWFLRRLGGLLKAGEATRLTGATTLSVGFTLAAVTLPGAPALAGILVAGVADPVAALVGRRSRGPRYPGGKSLAGSLAFAVVALGVMLALGLRADGALVAAALVAVAEAPSLPVDDNLYIPLAGAAALALGGWLTGM